VTSCNPDAKASTRPHQPHSHTHPPTTPARSLLHVPTSRTSGPSHTPPPQPGRQPDAPRHLQPRALALLVHSPGTPALPVHPRAHPPRPGHPQPLPQPPTRNTPAHTNPSPHPSHSRTPGPPRAPTPRAPTPVRTPSHSRTSGLPRATPPRNTPAHQPQPLPHPQLSTPAQHPAQPTLRIPASPQGHPDPARPAPARIDPARTPGDRRPPHMHASHRAPARTPRWRRRSKQAYAWLL
jgi:hypothetical protein